MGGMSIFHIFILLFYALLSGILFVPPMWRIVSKAGYSGAWSLLALVPVLNLLLLWVFAFSRWPNEGGRS